MRLVNQVDSKWTTELPALAGPHVLELLQVLLLRGLGPGPTEGGRELLGVGALDIVALQSGEQPLECDRDLARLDRLPSQHARRQPCQ